MRDSFMLDLKGTPAEVLQKTQLWIADFQKTVVEEIGSAVNAVKSDHDPHAVLAALKGRFTSAQEFAWKSGPDNLDSVLSNQIQQMVIQEEQVRGLLGQSGSDGALSGQYDEVSKVASKNVEKLKRCRESLNIIHTRMEETIGKVDQWNTFYQATVGLIGPDHARDKLVLIMEKEADTCREQINRQVSLD